MFSEGDEDDHLGDLEDGLACCISASCPDEGRAGWPASAATAFTPQGCADLCKILSAAPSNWQRVRPPPPAPQQDSGHSLLGEALSLSCLLLSGILALQPD